MKQLSINDFYAEFLSGNLLRPEFEGLIYKYLLFNQDNTCLCGWKREEYEDYISWFYPLMRKSIDSYQDTGSSFEAFIFRYFNISSKEYRTRITTNAITEYSAWSAQVPDMYVMYAKEEAPLYIHDDTENIISKIITDKSGRKNTKQMLALILKCYYYVSEDFAEKIAPKLGIDKKELLEKLKKIRKIRQKKDDKIYFMKERTQSQFLRCIVYEKRLLMSSDKEQLYNKLERKLEKARSRLEKMRKRITSIRTEATNKQIAEIIGITKGAVDSGFHKLKNKWEDLAKKAELN